MMTAAMNGHKKICGLLLSLGDSAEKKDIMGSNAIKHAQKNGHDELSLWLFRKGKGKSSSRKLE